MPGYRVRFDLTDVARRWSQVTEEFHKALNEEFDKVGGEMEAEAKRLVPVRTGYLRSTIYHQVRDLRLELGADAHYALFVE
ncbi:MAG: HK97 gp10 family phage protein, partial [Candidatus Bathyarchaeia archaeon]